MFFIHLLDRREWVFIPQSPLSLLPIRYDNVVTSEPALTRNIIRTNKTANSAATDDMLFRDVITSTRRASARTHTVYYIYHCYYYCQVVVECYYHWAGMLQQTTYVRPECAHSRAVRARTYFAFLVCQKKEKTEKKTNTKTRPRRKKKRWCIWHGVKLGWHNCKQNKHRNIFAIRSENFSPATFGSHDHSCDCLLYTSRCV